MYLPTKYGGQKGMTRFGQGFELVGHLHNVIISGWRSGLVSDPFVTGAFSRSNGVLLVCDSQTLTPPIKVQSRNTM